jgi:DNA-binding NarL/FixJ family response regulator
MSCTSPIDDSPREDRPNPSHAAIAGAASEASSPCDPAELWSQLVSGNLRVTEHFNAARRCFLVAATRPPAEVEAARLSPREVDVLTRTLIGVPQKCTAYDLALAQSTVACHLARALEKLNLSVSSSAIPLALVLVGQAACDGAPPSDARMTVLQQAGGSHLVASLACPEKCLPGLTAAEQDVANALAAGATKLEIARARLTSVNTIGRQITSLFGKLAVRGRFDLIRRMNGEAAATLESTECTKESATG